MSSRILPEAPLTFTLSGLGEDRMSMPSSERAKSWRSIRTTLKHGEIIRGKPYQCVTRVDTCSLFSHVTPQVCSAGYRGRRSCCVCLANNGAGDTSKPQALLQETLPLDWPTKCISPQRPGFSSEQVSCELGQTKQAPAPFPASDMHINAYTFLLNIGWWLAVASLTCV